MRAYAIWSSGSVLGVFVLLAVAGCSSPIEAKQISAYESHVCVVEPDGSVTCWGNDSYTETPEGEFEKVGSGSATCALAEDGSLECWGLAKLEDFDPSGPYVDVTEGGSGFVCALREGGSIECWGDDNYGQVSGVPDGTFTDLSAGRRHACALREDGSATCWGLDQDGQTEPPDGAFASLTSGDGDSFALDEEGGIAHWGAGAGKTELPEGPFEQIDVSPVLFCFCGVREDGTATCLGDRMYGVRKVPDAKFEQISCGKNFACGIKRDRTVTCWGRNLEGVTEVPSKN